jgi:LysR family positive regulator for ilvC
MDIRHLEIFLTLAELLHFGRASQACNLSPSALTRAIQRLEEELGQPLFVRDNRRVTLSTAGERFRAYARRTVQEWHAMRGTLQDTAVVSGSLSIYASVTAVYSLLPRLLEAFRSAYREVQLELRTGVAERAVALVQSGEIDLAVAALPDRHRSQLQFLPIINTPLLFIAPRQSEAAQLPLRDGIVDLRRAPLVVPQRGLSRRRLDQWLKEQRITPNITSEVSGNEALIAMVRLGCGIGIVPELVLARSPFRDEIRILDAAPQLDPYVVGLCTSKRNLQRPVVQAFWQLAVGRSGVKVDFQ